MWQQASTALTGLVCGLLCLPAQGQPIIETDIENAAGESFAAVLFPPQNRVMLHDGMKGRKKLVFDPTQGQWLTPQNTGQLKDMYALGLYGRADTVYVGPTFESEAPIYDLISNLDTDADWELDDVEEYPFYDDTASPDMRLLQATDILATNALSGVMFLEFAYLLTPEIDKVRVIAKIGVYKNKRRFERPKAVFKQNYEYFSPSRGVALRPWQVAEKEELMHAINEFYDKKLAKWPRNRSAYEKDRKSELGEIKNRTAIPVSLAIRETWNEELLASEFQRAIKHLAPLITADLRRFKAPRTSRGKLTEIDYVNWGGMHTRISGSLVDRKDGQLIYRDRWRNVYSIPDSE